MKIVHIAGARPNFVKIASILKACNQYEEIESVLVHTGQHYSKKMSDDFFTELEIPEPDINLEVGSASHAQMTAEIMKRIEPVLMEHQPDALLVVGDVNSTIACALVASKLGIKIIHVEAGLRSYDRTMPEEINRILTDSISDYLIVSEPSGELNLLKEGIPNEKIYFAGNVMIDTLLNNREKAQKSTILEDLNIRTKAYALLTLHRPSNVDDKHAFDQILQAIEEIQKEITIVFPIHPRTEKLIEAHGLKERIDRAKNIRLIEPQSYLSFLKLTSHAKFILTDSGGVQEESTVLSVPCLTLRENTERPITLTDGTSTLVGADADRIIEAYRKIDTVDLKVKPPNWDGKAGDRIAKYLVKHI